MTNTHSRTAAGDENPRLEPAEVEQLATCFDTRSAANVVLDQIGFPRSDIPHFGTPREFWNQIARELENGKIRGGRTRLLAAAHGIYPKNKTFAIQAAAASSPDELDAPPASFAPAHRPRRAPKEVPVTPPTENTPGARTSVTRKIITVILSLAAAALTLTVTWPNTGGGQDPSEDNGLGSDAPLTAPWSSTFLASLNQRLDLDRAPAEDDAPESGDGDQVWDALVQPDELYVNTGKNVIIASSSDREECAAAATSDPSVPFTQGQVVCVRTDQRHVVILEFVADRGSQIQIRGRLVP